MNTFEALGRRSKLPIRELNDPLARKYFMVDADWPIGFNDTMQLYVFVRNGDTCYGNMSL